MIDRLRELLRADGVTAWDVWAEASWEAEPDGMWSLAPFVRWAERELIIACSPDTIRELLDAHDRMAGALRRYIVALDRVNDPDDTDNTVDNFEAAVAELETVARAALAVPKEENPE